MIDRLCALHNRSVSRKQSHFGQFIPHGIGAGDGFSILQQQCVGWLRRSFQVPSAIGAELVQLCDNGLAAGAAGGRDGRVADLAKEQPA